MPDLALSSVLLRSISPMMFSRSMVLSSWISAVLLLAATSGAGGFYLPGVAPTDFQKCVQWHTNCNYIATGSSDKTVRLWDVQTGECARIFIGHRSPILSLAMSPDGRFMASGDEDGAIMIWDLSNSRCISPLMGHNSSVWSLAFSREGSLLASGSADCTVKLWDVTFSVKGQKAEESKTSTTNRLRLLRALPTKSTPVYTLPFSRRNLLFAAGALSKC